MFYKKCYKKSWLEKRECNEANVHSANIYVKLSQSRWQEFY